MWLCLPPCLLAGYLAACAPMSAGTAHTAPVTENASLANAVRQRLLAERESELADLQVQVESGGTVRLSGRTYTLAMADRAVQIARTTPGVTRVRSDILALPETQR
jgi:osmotically-inducible protein OsmY